MRVQAANVSFSTEHQLQRNHRVTETRREPIEPTVRKRSDRNYDPTGAARRSRQQAILGKSVSEKSVFEKPVFEKPVFEKSVFEKPEFQKTVLAKKGNFYDESLQFSNAKSHGFLPGPRSSNASVQTQFPQGLNADIQQIKQILEAYFGFKINVSMAVAGDGHRSLDDSEISIEQNNRQTAEPAAETWVHLSLREAEHSRVGIHAEITLHNGKTLSISMEQSMARRLSVERKMSEQEALKMIDPLVINFGGPVQLSANKVDFDLNADGETEAIARFAGASAYIALDKNGDGVINDGSELFGVASGDGFADLAEYDDDGNGFIDAGDAIFSELRLFRPGEKFTQLLTNTDVEAIYLGSVATPFQLQNSEQEISGQVRSTGFYLTADGADTVQQIDLVV